MTKKYFFIGLTVGFIANIVGVIAYVFIFSKLSLLTTLQIAQEQGYLGSILALGAILNLFAFFGFLKLKRDQRARGVLLATMLTAIFILIEKFI